MIFFIIEDKRRGDFQIWLRGAKTSHDEMPLHIVPSVTEAVKWINELKSAKVGDSTLVQKAIDGLESNSTAGD